MESAGLRIEDLDLRALVRGNQRARERFFDHFYDRIHGYVLHTVRDQHLAEDLTHEVFLKLDGSLHRLDPDRDPSPWVFTVAANAIRDHFRRRATKAQREAVDVTEIVDAPVDQRPAADAALVVAEDHRRVNEALEDLSPSDRQLILLREWEGLDLAQIATILEIRPDAVRQRWSRAIRRLGDAYRAMGSEEVSGA